MHHHLCSTNETDHGSKEQPVVPVAPIAAVPVAAPIAAEPVAALNAAPSTDERAETSQADPPAGRDKQKKIRAGKVLVRDSWWVNLGIHELSRTDFDAKMTVGTTEVEELSAGRGATGRRAAARGAAESERPASPVGVAVAGECAGCSELRERVGQLEARVGQLGELSLRSVERAVEFRLAAVEMAVAGMRTNSLRLVPATGLGVNVNASTKAGSCSPSMLRGGAGQEDHTTAKRGRPAKKRICAHGKEQNECRQCAASGLAHLTRFCEHLQRKNMCKLCDLQTHGRLRKRKFDADAMREEATVYAQAISKRCGLE